MTDRSPNGSACRRAIICLAVMAATGASGAARAQTALASPQTETPAASPPTNGVAVPDATVDPGIAKAPPATGATTPIIKPPLQGERNGKLVVPK